VPGSNAPRRAVAQSIALAATPATYALCGADVFSTRRRLPARIDHLRQPYFALRSGPLAAGIRASSPKASVCSIFRLRATALSEYHVEAAIAAVHSAARGAADTDWAAIVNLYDRLMKIRLSASDRAQSRDRRRAAGRSASAGWKKFTPSLTVIA
jgi:hypothetical protein